MLCNAMKNQKIAHLYFQTFFFMFIIFLSDYISLSTLDIKLKLTLFLSSAEITNFVIEYNALRRASSEARN